MAMTPPALVVGAPRVPLPYGLFSVVPVREDVPDRWESGVVFEGIGCPGSLTGTGPWDCETNAPSTGVPKTLDGAPSQDTADNFLVYESYTCSPIGNTLGHAQDVATARLNAFEEARVEAVISTGALGFAPAFSSAEVVGTEDQSLGEAIGLLEALIASAYGSQGILHMSRYTATLAIDKGIISAKSGRLRTGLDTPVVAGTGYTFTGVVATPNMFAYRSEVLTSSARPGDLLDRSNNDLYAVAERNYVVGWEDCGLYSAAFSTSSSGPSDPTVITAGANATVTGSGTADDPYVIGGVPGVKFVGGQAITVTDVGDNIYVADLKVDPEAGNTASVSDAGLNVPPDGVQVVEAGAGIAVDSTDPTTPVVSTSATE